MAEILSTNRANERPYEGLIQPSQLATTLQSIMNAKLDLHRFWYYHENGLIKTIQTIVYNEYVSIKWTSLY